MREEIEIAEVLLATSEVKYKESSHDSRRAYRMLEPRRYRETNVRISVDITDGDETGLASPQRAPWRRAASTTRRALGLGESASLSTAQLCSRGLPYIVNADPSRSSRRRRPADPPGPGRGAASPGVGEFLQWTTATRCPTLVRISRSVPSSGAADPHTTNRIPAVANWCVLRDRTASTADRTARSATFKIAPGPLTAATASRGGVVCQTRHHPHAFGPGSPSRECDFEVHGSILWAPHRPTARARCAPSAQQNRRLG